MLYTRRFRHLDLFQVLEFTGPTHDAAEMLPDITAPQLAANKDWLYPDFWMPETNRLVFSYQFFVLKTAADIIIIDAGVGNFKNRSPSPSQHQLNNPVIDWLKGIGCAPDKVKHVVQTHLHGDHVGWNTYFDNGQWVPTFPNATYYFPEDDWKTFHGRHLAGQPDRKGSFIDSVLPIANLGLAKFVKGGDEIAGVLTAIAAPGHSPGQLMYRVDAGEENCLFSADVIHCPIQIQYPNVNSRWCEFPDLARSSRLSLLKTAVEAKCLVFPAHTRGLNGWRISAKSGEFNVSQAK